MRLLRTGHRDHRDWRTAEFVAIDFETTTASPRTAQPLSVGWVAIRAGRVRLSAAQYHVVAYDGDLPSGGLPIHKLLPHQVRGGIPPAQAFDRMQRAVTDRIVVAHGAWIEQAMLRRFDADHLGLVDTMAIVRRLDERAGTIAGAMSLSAISRRFGVPTLRAHHAFGDALTTALLMLVLATQIERQRGHCPVDDLLRLGRRR